MNTPILRNLLDWLLDPVGFECPLTAQGLRDLARDEIVRLRNECERNAQGEPDDYERKAPVSVAKEGYTLAPCACGQIPLKLVVDGENESPKYAYVSGYCCDEWAIHFRNNRERIGSPASIALARAAWTKAPRCQGAAMEQLHAKGRKAWADVPDASKWVDELRGGDDLLLKTAEGEQKCR